MASENCESQAIEKTWWQWRSKKEKKLLIITPIIAIIITTVVVTIFIYDSKRDNCSTEICKVAEYFGKAMDTSVDPCEDFYKYSCGNWLATVNASVSSIIMVQVSEFLRLQWALRKKMGESNLISAHEKLIEAYNSCINADIEETKQILIKEIGGMPDFDKQWNENTYDLSEAIANASRKATVKTLISISVSFDLTNTRRNLITLGPPSYIYDPEPPSYSKLSHVCSFLSNRFPRDLSHKFINSSQETKVLVKDLVNIHNSTSNISPEKVYRIYKMNELNNAFPGVNFTKIIQLEMQDALSNTKVHLMEDEEVAVTNVEYIKKFAELVGSRNHSLRAYANYIGYNVMYAFKLHQHNDINTTDYNNKEDGTIDAEVCIGFFSYFLGYAVDRIYVDYIRAREKSNKQILEIIDYVKREFEIQASRSKWLDSSTLSAVMDKLKAMRKFVGYPPWILDDEKLNAHYKRLPNMDSTFVDNIRKIRQFSLENRVMTLHQLNDLKQNSYFPGTTTTVNALYFYHMNAIWLPLGIQNIPFYYDGLPMYLNFGSFGSIIGHEITHGFDNQGSLCDKNGNYYNWWTKDTKKKFDEKSKCFIRQYNSYYDKSTKMNVNGTQTLPEDIADNGGIKQSFLAYQNWVEKNGEEMPLPGFEHMTPNQLFFVAFGNLFCSHFQPELMRIVMKKDVHCQSPFRIWGAISNSKDFARTFNCKKGSKMNPKDKCMIW